MKLEALFDGVWPSVSKYLMGNIFSATPPVLGFPPDGQSQYWRGMNLAETESVVRFMQSKVSERIRIAETEIKTHACILWLYVTHKRKKRRVLCLL